MQHQISQRKLGRTSSHRRAMFRNMVTSLITHDRIETTLPKAKEMRRIADRMVTLGKKGSLAARRQAAAYVKDNAAVQKLFSQFAERYKNRNGGYTRIIKLGNRHGDAAPMAIIEYVEADASVEAAAPKKKAAKKTTKKSPKKTAAAKSEDAVTDGDASA